MKSKIIFLLLSIVSYSAFSQCADPCQFKAYFMHNMDTTKYSMVDFSQQGYRVFAENITLGNAAKIQVDSYRAIVNIESYYPGGQNFVTSDNTGVSLGSSEDLLLSSAKKVIIKGGNYSVTIEEVSGKTIIKAPNMPTTCTGQTSGTWANVGGFLKVCP